jgi:hypothetical protein
MSFKPFEVVLEPIRHGLFWSKVTRRLPGLAWDRDTARLRWGRAIPQREAAMIEGIEQLIAAGHVGQAWDTLDSEPARQVLRSHNRLYLLRASIARAGEVRDNRSPGRSAAARRSPG